MSESPRWQVSPGDIVALAAAVVALAGAWELLERARAKTDPRRALVRVVKAVATPKDLVFVADESPSTLAALAPLPALAGFAPMDDLRGVRQVFALGGTPGSLAPWYARFGPGRALDAEGRAVTWEIPGRHLAQVSYDANAALLDRVTARREGGADAGECPREGGRLVCRGPEWNALRAEPHTFDGAVLPCVYAHPHPDGTLVVVFEQVPPSRVLVGTVGIDDVAWFPEGAPVNVDVQFAPVEGPAVPLRLVAPNRKGVTPYRLEVPERAGSVVWRISSPNISSRQLCFTMRALR